MQCFPADSTWEQAEEEGLFTTEGAGAGLAWEGGGDPRPLEPTIWPNLLATALTPCYMEI